ncbi:MAG: ABC transporter permease [Hyphomicrobiales bacterium]|nr:MAG: ABC transporter permease [Hyphomicrobiales bacterium]
MKHWIDRQRYLIDFMLAALARRKTKNVGLIVVYTLIVFMIASVLLFGQALRREAGFILADAPEVTVQKVTMGRHDMVPGIYVDQLKSIRGVRQVEGRLWGYFYDRANGANYTVMVPPKSSDLPAIEAGEALVGEAVAKSRDVEAGKPLFLINVHGKLIKLIVREVLPLESALVSADLVVMNEADYRDFFNTPPGVYTDIAMTVRNAKEVSTVIEKAAKALPDVRFVTRDAVLRTYQSIFDWREGLLLVLLVGAALAFVIFAAEKASGLSAEEQREIGVLKAVGWETGDVIAMKFWEGALVSLTAFLIGYGLAFVHIFVFSGLLFEPVLKGWSVLYPEFSLAPHVDGLQIAILAFFSVVPYTAATLVPIWRTAITDPDQVMR